MLVHHDLLLVVRKFTLLLVLHIQNANFLQTGYFYDP